MAPAISASGAASDTAPFATTAGTGLRARQLYYKRAARSLSPSRPHAGSLGFERRDNMKSTVIKRSIVIEHHKTSISIEDAFWIGLKDIARERGLTLSALVASIDAGRTGGSNLSSAIRVFILDHFRGRLEQANRPGSAPGHGASARADPGSGSDR
jgi:predicted DNA-binding ribbon-helix-helix protein